MNNIKIRKAKSTDKLAISRLTKKYPDTLSRSPREIGKMIGNFWVAENENGRIIGCCGVKMWSSDAEIISWIVEEIYRESGVPKKILLAILGNLKKRKSVDDIFVATVPALAKKHFRPLGFLPTALQMFSSKVVEDCKNCPKNRLKNGHYQCNEVALVLKR